MVVKKAPKVMSSTEDVKIDDLALLLDSLREYSLNYTVTPKVAQQFMLAINRCIQQKTIKEIVNTTKTYTYVRKKN
jgi:hypothetical protein